MYRRRRQPQEPKPSHSVSIIVPNSNTTNETRSLSRVLLWVLVLAVTITVLTFSVIQSMDLIHVGNMPEFTVCEKQYIWIWKQCADLICPMPWWFWSIEHRRDREGQVWRLRHGMSFGRLFLESVLEYEWKKKKQFAKRWYCIGPRYLELRRVLLIFAVMSVCYGLGIFQILTGCILDGVQTRTSYLQYHGRVDRAEVPESESVTLMSSLVHSLGCEWMMALTQIADRWSRFGIHGGSPCIPWSRQQRNDEQTKARRSDGHLYLP